MFILQINCFPNAPDYYFNDRFEESLFGMLALLLIFLVYYYSISKRNKTSKNLKIEEKPIYETLDVLLQEKNVDFNRINFIPLYQNKVSNSAFVKVFIVISILFYFISIFSNIDKYYL